MWQIYFYSLALLAISTGAKNETTERINMSYKQIARSDHSEFIAKKLREALSIGRATVSQNAKELTTAANPNGNSLQLIELPQTMWGSLSQKSGQRQIYNDPSADLPSHRNNNYDYNPNQISEENFHSTNLPELILPSAFRQNYKNYTTVIANSQNSIAEENSGKTTQNPQVQVLIPYYGQKLANFDETDETVNTNTQSYQSELHENCMRSLNHKKATEEKQVQCPVCKRGFQYESRMNSHLRIHTGEKSHSCSICAKKFSMLSNLKMHEKIHSGEKPYQCRVCNKNFSRSHNLNIHLTSHTGEKPHQCSICAYKCNFVSEMRRHERIHSQEKPYRCQVCNKNFSRSHDLEIHERIHTGEKPYQCSICAFKCNCVSSMRRHERIHWQEKPHRCRVCNKKFSQSNNLKIHERIHTGEKPYPCSICAFKSSSMSSMRRHERIHSKEKPYQCQVCNRNFSQSNNLKIHERIHTGEKLYLCNI